ncbi:MAG: phosphoribosylaminoimidazole-succinocarboxamide synthase [Candidatus Peregrinibacteria bacterium Greene1014_49]|nr:MAG: phosphoribosylaminoimidazole-succinocarboxamide synthase [Candidatus Peregrinibacteria bacterium Greene1014_49]
MFTADQLRPYLPAALEKTDFKALGERYQGKVRDVYTQPERNLRILVATDRQSAFDIQWCSIPLKGQVLNQISAWWFERIVDIMPTQVLDVPDPNVTVAKRLQMMPIEIVVRGYLTGSSKTSAWMNYNAGVRDFCGVRLPDGMVKNQPFTSAILTPTTKGEDDELIDPPGIFTQKLATETQWEEIADKALKLFARGQELAAKRGLILVDTKYEMGLDEEGTLMIADEVHTPDSSRYWVAASYEKRFAAGLEPESLDKEFFRLWLRTQGFEYGDKATWPKITDNVRLALSAKYIDLFERITGQKFTLPPVGSTAARIEKNLAKYRVGVAA